jgi:hypothetical protein
MDGPRLTEERLRHHLDANQVMRERMCLALLPLLGPFTREQPRRPKGGADGARDIEAVYQGQMPVWGAVGFKNGGGSDTKARAEAAGKFRSDLDSALTENPTLPGFVFFTNVDLTLDGKEELVRYAHGKNVTHVDVFDMERLRQVLDSPEGLIARLQYLDIPMSATEQAALVGKFGSQLQQAVTARFDRVERTLAQMEHFLSFQKPILRIDVYIELDAPVTSAELGDEAVLVRIGGLHDLPKLMSFLCVNKHDYPKANTLLLTEASIWNEDAPDNILTMRPSRGQQNVMRSFNELSLTTGGNRVRLADLTIITVEAVCTEGIRAKIKGIAVDANGYELLNHTSEGQGECTAIKWPEKLAYNAAGRRWVVLVPLKQHNFVLTHPKPSGRFTPLVDIPG